MNGSKYKSKQGFVSEVSSGQHASREHLVQVQELGTQRSYVWTDAMTYVPYRKTCFAPQSPGDQGPARLSPSWMPLAQSLWKVLTMSPLDAQAPLALKIFQKSKRMAH